jgi:hypothetical protein
MERLILCIFIFLVVLFCVICGGCAAIELFKQFNTSLNKSCYNGGDARDRSSDFVLHKGGQTHLMKKPQGIKNVMIIDVANMYVGWYMEKHNTSLPYNSQPQLIKNYTRFMSDHYARFAMLNPVAVNNSDTLITYVIKNYKSTSPKSKMTADKIPDHTWDMLKEFVRCHANSQIVIAEDYSKISFTKWKNKKNHYLRGRDDYLCFLIAQQYKKQYITPFIMTDDKFSDFEDFGKTPKFKATFLYGIPLKSDKHISDKIPCRFEQDVASLTHDVLPKPNQLGQISDYNIAKVALNFSFSDLGHRSGKKIPLPGYVWGFN